MDVEYSQINNFLVTVFNEVLRTEEISLKTKEFHNLSMREMHVIEAVCDAAKNGKNTASEIAFSQIDKVLYQLDKEKGNKVIY